MQYVQGMVSLHNLTTRPGDTNPIEFGSRGDIARTKLCSDFLSKPEYDAILQLDLDMDHPPDLLEWLRNDMTHGNLDMVTGHYFRRQSYPAPMLSIISLLSTDDTWSYPSLLDLPDSGLMEVACTGMGNVLIHRRVVEAVAKRLPPGDNPFAMRPMPRYAGGYHHNWGSDYAFFTLARSLGYRLWLDCAVESKHAVTFWVGRELYKIFKPHNDLTDYYFNLWWADKEIYGMNDKTVRARNDQLTYEAQGYQRKADELRAQRVQLDGAIEQCRKNFESCVTRIDENKAWLGDVPTAQVRKVGNLPIFKDEAEMKAALSGQKVAEEGDVRPAREDVYAQEAMQHVEALDKREPAA